MDFTDSPTALLDPPDTLPEAQDTNHAAPTRAAPHSVAHSPSHLPPPPSPPPPPDSRSRVPEFLEDPALLDALLDDYLEGLLPLHRLASAHGLTVADLLLLLETPLVSGLLDGLTRHAELQAHRLALIARPRAVARLAFVGETDPADRRTLPPAVESRSRETTRKAAAHIERISRPPRPSRPTKPVAPACDAPQASAHPDGDRDDDRFPSPTLSEAPEPVPNHPSRGRNPSHPPPEPVECG